MILKIKTDDMCVSFGFFRAIAEKKRYLQSGFRPENREISGKRSFLPSHLQTRRFVNDLAPELMFRGVL